ncbi:RluA family pseudouridine synthase [Tenacibaculum piscium]|uniref:RluA family pseudouridine synthase n=1 Tax=Tenacibaculum piscium TaxID=1458515 RepID=UPI001EFBB474|nr:RluA family pseudouridine synthase [Tenacibaculum piscium]MCG8184044.1 RluA family pseudouridine synthase [Tenacibaculum piscium]MCG8205437.1 RluA family pseudouridine synthase [Tenacibaculum piscium]
MPKFIEFTSDISNIEIPEKFDYPHNYTPHILARIASEELQEYLKIQTDFSHNFQDLGKMFGVLIVKNKQNKIGYLSAFSGKIAQSTHQKHFVPPVYDVLKENGIFLQTEKVNNQINQEILILENNSAYLKTKKNFLIQQKSNENLFQEEQKILKKRRQLRKLEAKQDNQQNINEEFYLREYQIYLKDKIRSLEKKYTDFQQQIEQLKQQRKELSASGQQEIFKQYQFLNTQNNKKNLTDIFKNSTLKIPAGAGDCCAPKLLQYAFLNNFTPICMAEFWWGSPLATSVRKHKNYYDACSGKCKPILKHMLKGIAVHQNPLLLENQEKTKKDTQKDTQKELEIIFEDAYLVAINKPTGLLSVAGKEISDSVENRIQKKHPNALVAHRLDRQTSGILLIAKTLEIYKKLQIQFINKTIKKRYVAVLDGVLSEENGEINLPLRVNLEDRPKQLVCELHGKKALTKWEIIKIKNAKTYVYFYPITGRTHQLRVHSAHYLGLNSPIIGDDLYGKKANRLYLHAQKISFIHPVSKKIVTFKTPTPF